MVTTADIEKIIRSEIEPAIADLASDAMPFYQELQVANNFFCAIERAKKISVAEKWIFDIDLIKRILDERLGKGKKHISTFAFHKAAKMYLCQNPNTDGDRTALINHFTNNNVFPKIAGPEDGLPILVGHYFKKLSDALEEPTENRGHAREISNAARKKLIRSLKALEAPLGEVERESLAKLVGAEAKKLPDNMGNLRTQILGYRK